MDIREHIINRLHERAGTCDFCGKHGCGHPNTNLPSTLDRGDVLWAINLDGYFDTEDFAQTRRESFQSE